MVIMMYTSFSLWQLGYVTPTLHLTVGVGVDTTRSATRHSTRAWGGVDTSVGKESDLKCRNREQKDKFETLDPEIEGGEKREKNNYVGAFVVEEKTPRLHSLILIFTDN